MDVPRSLTTLGLLLVCLSLFLAWFPTGTNISGLYLSDGALNTSPLTSSTNGAVTLTFFLYPLGLLIAIWAAWKRRITPWQALIIVPSIAWTYNQVQQGLSLSVGPILGLSGGIILVAGYVTNVRFPRNYQSSRQDEEYRANEYRSRNGPWSG